MRTNPTKEGELAQHEPPEPKRKSGVEEYKTKVKITVGGKTYWYWKEEEIKMKNFINRK